MSKYITVISDTHGNLFDLDLMRGDFLSSNYIFFLGDGIFDMQKYYYEFENKVYMVKGNCDGFIGCSTELIVEVEGVKILLTHGHSFGVKESRQRLAEFAKKRGCTLCLYGHTHTPLVEEIDGITLACPGALASHSLKKTFIQIKLENGNFSLKIIPLLKK